MAILALTIVGSIGAVSWSAIYVVVIGVLLTILVGSRIATATDRRWLPKLLPVAFLAKMIGGFANFYYSTTLTSSNADALAYHESALAVVPTIRHMQLPDLLGGGFGTRSTRLITGVIYSVATPDILGGFLIFSCISFAGLILFYLAFRQAAPGARLEIYFIGVFFLPTLLFFPSAIGKDSLMTLFLGLVAVGVSYSLTGRSRVALAVAALGIVGAFTIRPHIAAILTGAVLLASVAALVSKTGRKRSARDHLATLIIALTALVFLGPVATRTIGADEGVLAFAEDVARNTSIGGSAIEPRSVVSPTSIPLGVVTALSRPFVYEATSATQGLVAIESAGLLVVGVFVLPRFVRGWRIFLRRPYFTFAVAFVLGFLIAFSNTSNLGIIARQRAQMLPFLLAAIVVLIPWSSATEPEMSPASVPESAPIAESLPT